MLATSAVFAAFQAATEEAPLTARQAGRVRATLGATASASFTFNLETPEASLSAPGVAANAPAATQPAPGQATAFIPGRAAETKACGSLIPVLPRGRIGACVIL